MSHNARKVVIRGQEFSSITAAAEHFGRSDKYIRVHADAGTLDMVTHRMDSDAVAGPQTADKNGAPSGGSTIANWRGSPQVVRGVSYKSLAEVARHFGRSEKYVQKLHRERRLDDIQPLEPSAVTAKAAPPEIPGTITVPGAICDIAQTCRTVTLPLVPGAHLADPSRPETAPRRGVRTPLEQPRNIGVAAVIAAIREAHAEATG